MKSKVCILYARHDLRVEMWNIGALGPDDVLIQLERGGICGSDLHFYHDGGIGAVRVREPLILGHEIAGRVDSRGANVDRLEEGMRVAINPSAPCNRCDLCTNGHSQHCPQLKFLGAARTMPHVQGGFRQSFIVPADQCFPVAEGVSAAEAACAEPLAVCLHGVDQAGDLSGKRVLVTGAGPIGALCAALTAKIAQTVHVTDVQDFALDIAKTMGATAVTNMAKTGASLDEPEGFDIVFECSGAPSAIETAIANLRPRGTLVQIGLAGKLALPINELVAKEITYRGSQRFHDEFAKAVTLINNREIDVRPVITQTFAIDDAVAAFDLASDRSRAIKVQIDLG